MHKKVLEKKQREEQEATAHAFHEFIKTFQDVNLPPNKLFVRSGIWNGSKEEENDEKGKIYNPTIPFKSNNNATLKHAIECAKLIKDNKLERIGSTKHLDKPKSNLELLKEELRLRQLERNEKLKCHLTNNNQDDHQQHTSYNFLNNLINSEQSSTNLFVANINPKLSEQDLIKIFGTFGPLASVKIMWPKNDDKSRSNCGFVAYMSRKDGERAIQELKNYDDMRIGWGKPVELPTHPIYIPPSLLKLLLPPPYTGLPFNAQPIKQTYEYPKNDAEMQELLYNSYVKVTIPLDKKLLMLIHRTIEFVVNEGPLFEAIIMNKEINNPAFQFLFDNKCPSHVYYRWKLYSILKGESQNHWSLVKFRMFDGGSIWIPPVLPDYTKGMPDKLIKEQEKNNNLLSVAQRNRLIQYLQNLNTNRNKIGEAMVFCLNHGEASQEIADIIMESLTIPSTLPIKKLARLYLISDVLRNSTRRKSDNYRNHFTKWIVHIFEQLKATIDDLTTKPFDQSIFKTKIANVLKAWDTWKIFSNELLFKLDKALNGSNESFDGDDSGNDEPLDGKNLMKRFNDSPSVSSDGRTVITAESLPTESSSSSKLMTKCQIQSNSAKKVETSLPPGFVPSKWETIDPEELEAQAMSTKKFHDIEMENQMKLLKEERFKVTDRLILRQVELEVMKYQDDLESGSKRLKSNYTIEQQVNDYRDYLLNKAQRNQERSPSNSDDDFTTNKKSKQLNNKKRKRSKY